MNDTLAQAVIEDGDVMLKSIAVWKGCLIGALALSVPFFRGLSFADKLALLWYLFSSVPFFIGRFHLLFFFAFVPIFAPPPFPPFNGA
jgi:hypothetical protein